MPTPPPAPEEKGKTLEEIIFMALGEASAWFMTHPDGTEIVMPSRELEEIGNKTVNEISKHYARIEGEKEELVTMLGHVKDLAKDLAGIDGLDSRLLIAAEALIAKHTTSSPQGK